MEFVLKFWTEFAFTALAGGVTFLIKKYMAMGCGIQALLRDRIIQAHNYYMDKGYCPIYAKENVEEMYKQYHNLGGNGTITKLYETMMAMPTERMISK